MRIKRLTFLAILIAGLSFVTTVVTQESDVAVPAKPSKCADGTFVLPASISSNNDAFSDYLKIASLSPLLRQKAFQALLAEQKASFIRVQLALRIANQPKMSDERRKEILGTIARVTSRSFDTVAFQKVALANQNLSWTDLSKKETVEVLSGLSENKDRDIALLKPYEELLSVEIARRRSIVKDMKIDERVGIWQAQMAYHLATSSFNTEQNEFIVEMIPKIRQIIELSSKLSKEEAAKYVNGLESSIFKLFTKPEAHAVFMSIGIQNRGPKASPLTSDSQVHCNCRVYCDLQDYECISTPCIENHGCGPIGTWTCYYRCMPVDP